MNKRKFSILIAIVSIALMTISLIGIFGPKKDYLKTTGTIVNIVESIDSTSDSIEHKAIINYEVNGIKYQNVEYGAYNSSMKIGDEVIVYYEEKSPSNIQSEGYEKVPYVVLTISGVSLIISILLFIKK